MNGWMDEPIKESTRVMEGEFIQENGRAERGEENHKMWRRKWQPTPVILPGKSVDRGAWWATVHGVSKVQTWLRTTIFRNSVGHTKHISGSPFSASGLISFFPFGSLIHRGTCLWVCSAHQCLDSTKRKLKIEDGPTLPVEHQVQKEYTGKEMAFHHSPPLFGLSAGNVTASL